ncbi:MAG: hypothetical protein UX09_C0055G0008 [Candidatus Uhrbacteria bacterium GW2011_GWE2_45_35]|uniref:Uncharacterized protein n=2 Tax=Candidatus Uhriibacteriota TaxID=1752732 RepID=A0A0G1JCI6_9BACT|nr:MAG: hypothetical protein UW63_C0064G0008 [Candidatus Uhrbacteria bacterium GW2011_GWF2_44_350]KKU06264.1 MAG: hypothetical protein UX09_C0055G0008 [Candidatus Uhrbacteria bacterium GW2011_GWE2_45_35]HBR80448.1 hypothetical protein [Candidatus Uhrbacteria bacterium]HCU31321.1 hypothetical protein [Candidatus Uhrbacteria bacterium]
MKKEVVVTPGQMIADGWGNRRALEAEKALKAIDEELAANDSRLESGEMEFEVWEAAQAALREKIPAQQQIIREEKARYQELLAERRVA